MHFPYTNDLVDSKASCCYLRLWQFIRTPLIQFYIYFFKGLKDLNPVLIGANTFEVVG